MRPIFPVSLLTSSDLPVPQVRLRSCLYNLATDRLSTLAHHNVPLAATRIYQMAFFTGFGVSAIIYYVLNRIWPTPGAFQKFEEIDESEFAERQQEAMEKKQKESQEGSVDEKDKDAGSDDHDVEVRQV